MHCDGCGDTRGGSKALMPKRKGLPETVLIPAERMERLWTGVRALVCLYSFVEEGV